jgi:hypothetical protein
MKFRAVAAAGVVLLLGVFIVPLAFAADGGGGSSTVTATITSGSVGSRSITSVPAISMTSALNSASLSGAYTVVVTEAARTGTNAWSVTGEMQNNQLTSGANTIASTALAVSGRAVVQVAGGGTSTAPDPETSEALGTARTLLSNSGQSTSAVYTGTYTGTGNLTLTPPNGAATGVYTGTFVVTLV